MDGGTFLFVENLFEHGLTQVVLSKEDNQDCGVNVTACIVVTLTVDGNIVGSGEIPWMMSTISSVGMSVALDAGSPVSREYAAPFAFEGDLQTMEFQLISRQDAEARKAELAAEMGRQ